MNCSFLKSAKLIVSLTVFSLAACNNSSTDGKSQKDSARINQSKLSPTAVPSDQRAIDSVKTLYSGLNFDSLPIYIDTTFVPTFICQTDLNTLKRFKSTRSNYVTLYSGENYTGESLVLGSGKYTCDQLSKFISTGIRSLKAPLGSCLDINYYKAGAPPGPSTERHPDNRPGGKYNFTGSDLSK